MTFKVTTIDYMFTNNITAGINYFKYKAGKRKIVICKIEDTINLAKYKKVAIIAYEKYYDINHKQNEFYIILNYYNKVARHCN